MGYRVLSQGFALPTVVITTGIMFAVLVAAVSVVSSTRVSLDVQFFEGLAADAAESGATHAESCLKDNNFIGTWTTNNLRPNSTCSGTSTAAYLVNTSQYRTTYQAEPPQDIGNGVQTVRVTGMVELLRTNGQVWNTYRKVTYARLSSQVQSQSLALGYRGVAGVFFGVIGFDGVMRGVGYNEYGTLGDGTTTNRLTPVDFDAPTSYPLVKAYSSFLSVGYQLFAIDTQGDVYGAGTNDGGQLGNGSTAAIVSTPVKFGLPAGVGGASVSVLGSATFVIGTDNNIYASGKCAYGILGSGYTISGCANRSTYVRVSLPTPNTSDPNTIPDYLVADRYTVFVRMMGGRVYGWGINDLGSLATGDNTNSSTPVQIGTFGNSGQPKAVQIAFDGETLYVLDDTGQVYVTGGGSYGALAGAPSQIQYGNTTSCLNMAGAVAGQARIYNCINAETQQIIFRPFGTINATYASTGTDLCLANTGPAPYGNNTNGNPVNWANCLNSSQSGYLAQQWLFVGSGAVADHYSGTIVQQGTGKCLTNASGSAANDTALTLSTCNGTVNQKWSMMQSSQLVKVPMPTSDPATGKVVQVATDQYSVMFRTETGQLWGAGGNSMGQLCNGVSGTSWTVSNRPTQVQVPAGYKVVDVMTTKVGEPTDSYGNTYFILDNGDVYGCGANTFGQIGDGSPRPTEHWRTKMNLPAGVQAASVQSGLGTTVVLTTNGLVYTVGNNSHGQLGDGTTTNRSTPILGQYINPQSTTKY